MDSQSSLNFDSYPYFIHMTVHIKLSKTKGNQMSHEKNKYFTERYATIFYYHVPSDSISL